MHQMQAYNLHSYPTDLPTAWQQVKNKADQKTPLSQLFGALGGSGFFLVWKRNRSEQTKAQPVCQPASSSTQPCLLSLKKTENSHRTHLCTKHADISLRLELLLLSNNVWSSLYSHTSLQKLNSVSVSKAEASVTNSYFNIFTRLDFNLYLSFANFSHSHHYTRRNSPHHSSRTEERPACNSWPAKAMGFFQAMGSRAVLD